MKKESEGYEAIPAWEFGPGCELDWQHNRLIGVSGRVYEDVQVKRADVERIIAEHKKQRLQ